LILAAKFNNNFFKKEYKLAKDKSTGLILKHLQKEYSNLLGNLQVFTRDIEHFFSTASEVVVSYLDFINFEN
jgi:hypothetical protein